MSIKYYSCKLLSDIVINASLATEGNMKTLDYIPGSNFWGIVAGQYYGGWVKEKSHQQLLDLFHNGTVSFGDAHIALNCAPSYRMPFSLAQNKLQRGILKYPAYLHHLLLQREERMSEKNEEPIQYKQHREGYFTTNHTYVDSVKCKFMLKSAQDRATRKSADQKMFGFQSIQAGQTFIFSVNYKDKGYIPIVEKALLGRQRIGKSKNAQYGQVMIQAIDQPALFTHQNTKGALLLIYALSNLCFIDEYGSATLRPDPFRDFKIKGKINWAYSQIRTYSYSPWNNHRKTSDAQRDCILKGSVIAIHCDEEIDVFQLQDSVGNYKAEGLGRVLYNPAFLEGDSESAIWSFRLENYEEYEGKQKREEKVVLTSPLGYYLAKQRKQAEEELTVSEAVFSFLKDSKNNFEKISNSQWGTIRSAAIKANDAEALKLVLFGTIDPASMHDKDNQGMLIQGVAAQRYWNKRGGKAREVLWKAIDKYADFAPTFMAKFASEMANQKNIN